MCADLASDAQGADLEALEAQVARELAFIEQPFRSWVPARRFEGHDVLDAVIVGAGLSGLSIGFGLKLRGVERVRLIDAAPEGLEGPWITSARMRTLRSPKDLTGPDLGIPSLTYRAWHLARFGPESWDQLGKVDRRAWMDYLIWFRRQIGLDVDNDTRLVGLSGENDIVRLALDRNGAPATLYARKAVLATGMPGAGGLSVPPRIVRSLPRGRWTHSGETFDLATLGGADVGVIGGASSSFDWSSAALDAGAATVTQLARRPALARTEVLDWSNFAGFLGHFSELDDLRRYRFTQRMRDFSTPPTQEMFDRAMAHANFRLLLSTPVRSATMDGGKVVVATGDGRAFRFDHLLLGTGYAVDLSRRAELASCLDNIALWADRFTPPPGEEHSGLLSFPYLGRGFEFTEKVPGLTPWLRHVHVFNSAAVLSLGPVCNGITGLKAGVPKIVAGLTRDLFIDDADRHYEALDRFDTLHFDPSYPRQTC